jgi:hypothetical protein
MSRGVGGDSGFFERVVAASGLAPVIAGPAMRRALTRAGVDPATMTSQDLAQAMASIETSLRVYLPNDVVAKQLEALRLLALRPDAHRAGP